MYIVNGLIGLAIATALLSFAALRWTRRLGRGVAVVRMVGVVVFALSFLLCGYGAWVSSGTRSPVEFDLAEGVTYERISFDSGTEPPAVGHLVTIDLGNPCVVLHTSNVQPDGTAVALKNITWAEQNSMLLAMNGSFFYPYEEFPTYWNVKPNEGDEVNVLGATVSTAGRAPLLTQSSDPAWIGSSVWIDANYKPSIGTELPESAVWGVTGREQILTGGAVTAEPSDVYALSAIGVDTASQSMWWFVVDGQQPGYSEGATLGDAAALLLERGASDAVEMDGGGSSIMTYFDGAVHKNLTRPVQIRIPGRSRTIANHVGLSEGVRPGATSDTGCE